MSVENTIDAVRLALGIHELRARTAGANVANAGKADASAMRVDFAEVEAALRAAASAGNEAEAAQWLDAAAHAFRGAQAQATGETINLDEQIADVATAGVEFQALTEALSRQFGLMRIAIAGRT